MKEFPIPVRTVASFSQAEDESLEYLPMPKGMASFRAPVLPEPEDVANLVLAHQALREVLVQLSLTVHDGVNRSVSLDDLPPADRQLINTVLGEGEVSALVSARSVASFELRVQESVFAGVWRVIKTVGTTVVSDSIEVGHVPQALREADAQDVWGAVPRWDGPLPPNVQNAPLLLSEIEDQCQRWQPGQAAHVVNLTLLPMSVEDIGFLDHHLGTGRVLILSRGYGNCRISNTCRPHAWRVVYYNSADIVIMNSVEVTDLPEVALAAKEDLQDSLERLTEVIHWVVSE